MNKQLIYSYISKLTKEDIIKFINNQNFSIEENEIDLIYNYIKTNPETIINNKELVLNDAKKLLKPDTYNNLTTIYNKYINIINLL